LKYLLSKVETKTGEASTSPMTAHVGENIQFVTQNPRIEIEVKDLVVGERACLTVVGMKIPGTFTLSTIESVTTEEDETTVVTSNTIYTLIKARD